MSSDNADKQEETKKSGLVNLNSPLSAAIDTLFSEIEQKKPQLATTETKGKFSSLPKERRKEIELAVTVLLVDLASSDQNFELAEYNAIVGGLLRLFGTTAAGVKSLINQSTLILKNLRGTSKFAETLRDSLSQNEREKIMQVIDEVISADGVEDGYETYLRHKFADILKIQLKPLNLPKKQDA